MQRLKSIRVVVSLLFFFLLSILFLDVGGLIPPSLTIVLVALQFVPSLTKTLALLSVTSLGLLFVVVLTLAFGRVYCSSLCPLGTLQDIVIRLARRNSRRRWFRYKKQPVLLHYSLLAVAAIAFVGGSALLLNLLEPFSNYGKILSSLVNPIVVLGNNAAVSVFGHFGLYSLPSIALRNVHVSTILFSLIFLGVILYMSYNHGRLFCNSLCPAGAP